MPASPEASSLQGFECDHNIQFKDSELTLFLAQQGFGRRNQEVMTSLPLRMITPILALRGDRGLAIRRTYIQVPNKPPLPKAHLPPGERVPRSRGGQ